MWRGLITVAWAVALCSLPGVGVADERAAELVRLLPAEANAIAIVRVADILKTERAVREQWAQRQAEEFLSGAAVVPPTVQLLVVGSLVHPSVPEEVWTTGLVSLPESTPFDAVAKLEGGTIQDLAGRPSVRSARDAVFVDLRPGLVGVRTPAFRQEAARWVRQISQPIGGGIAPSLLNAAEQPGHIVLAMDLRDMLDPERALAHLAGQAYVSQPSTRVHLGSQLVRIQSGLLTITVGDTLEAEVVFTFADDLEESAKVFHRVFLDVLGDLGIGIDEFAEAKATVDGKQLRLQTTLTEAGLRRILSLIVAPLPSRAAMANRTNETETAPAAPAPSTPRARPQANPSQVYLTAVNKAIDDLKVANRRAKDYERTATWHDNFARRIDNLPVGGVDKELLDYGRSVAGGMRALAASLRGQKVDIDAQARTFTYNVHFDPGWTAINYWGGAGYRAPTAGFDSNLQDVRSRQAEAVAAGAEQRREIWLSIDNQRGAIEQLMRQRYGDDFPK